MVAAFNAMLLELRNKPACELTQALTVHGGRSEQPTQESPLRPVLHIARTTLSVQPRQKLSVIHARTTAHGHSQKEDHDST